MKKMPPIAIALGALLFLALSSATCYAIPPFSRKYETSCSTCHYAYPKLNAFGKAFRNNGYRYPRGQDEEMTKQDPISLGSDSYKRVFPDAIWPSDIPGSSPIGIQSVGRASYKPDADVKTTFEMPHELEVFYGGTMGETFSLLGEIELENEDNETAIAFPFQMQYDYRPDLHVRMGNVSPDVTVDHHRLTREHNNVASLRSRHRWRLRGQQSGIEIWGARNGAGGAGGLTYGLGLVNGQNIDDANSEKDIYARVAYKIGGLGELGGTEGQASKNSAFYIDDSIQIGGLAYLGTVAKDGEKDEDLTVLGLSADWWFRRVNVFAALTSMNSSISGLPDRTSRAWFAEGRYVVYPWLIGLGRFEWTDADTDDSQDATTSLIPAVVVVARANVKFSLEYKLPLDDASKNKDAMTLQANFAF